MPELPEVETVRRGLAPFLADARIDSVILNRENLRFPFPEHFAARLTGEKISHVGRRAKYLLFALSGGETLLAHLGMTGNFRFANPNPETLADHAGFEKHDHVIIGLSGADIPSPFLVYSDPRRFGFMDLVKEQSTCKYLKGLGPEPLGNELTAQTLAELIGRRKAPVKSLLLDQRVIAGLGNIYVCEALHRAGINPETLGRELAKDENASPLLEDLVRDIRAVLHEALISGGSTLQDYRNVDGQTGYFQHRFAVYDREGEPCLKGSCDGTIARIVQSGRSSFYCPTCQIKKQ